MLKVGFIGCGGIAHAHVAGWNETRAAGTAQVTALCDVSAENMDRLEAALGLSGLPRYSDWKAMLAAEDVGAVDICLPHHLHAPAILDAAAVGRHVLIEKPLCLNFAEAEAITAAVEGAPITLMCAHNQLFGPAIRHLRGEIDRGLIGDVQMVFSGDAFRVDRADWGWRAKLETAGGGVLIDTGYHPTYRLLYAAGSPVTSVTSVTGRYHNPIEGEDTANVLLTFANGALGQILTSWAFPLPHGSWQVWVFGSEGAVYATGNRFRHQPWRGEASEQVLADQNGFAEEVKHFVSCLATGATPLQTHVDGINVLKVILGAYEAQRTGKTVTF